MSQKVSLPTVKFLNQEENDMLTPPDNGIYKVFVVGKENAVRSIFRNHNSYELTEDMSEAKIVVFTGGEDINPALYGEQRHHSVYWNAKRDRDEVEAYGKCTKDQYKFGICRGGQLLSVLNGEKLVQNADNHIGHHMAKFYIKATDAFVETDIVSVHHQLMDARIVKDHCILLGTAHESTVRDGEPGVQYRSNAFVDQEAIYFPKTRSFCFQSHPEYRHKNTTEIFFDLANDVLHHYDI